MGISQTMDKTVMKTCREQQQQQDRGLDKRQRTALRQSIAQARRTLDSRTVRCQVWRSMIHGIEACVYLELQTGQKYALR